MKKVVVLVALLVVLVVAAALLFSKGGTGAFAAGKPERLVIASTADWAPDGLLFVAKEKGFFEGVDVEIPIIASTDARRTAFLAGQIDGYATTLDEWVITAAHASAHGMGGKAVIQLDESAGADGILAKNDIASVRDFVGKRVAAEKGFASYALLRDALERNGLSVDDVDFVSMSGADAGAAFVAGGLDVAATWEPWLSKAVEANAGHVVWTSANSSGVIQDVIPVRAEALAQRPGAVKALMRGLFAAMDYFKEHPDEASEIIARNMGLTVEDVKATIAGNRLPSYEEQRQFFGAPGARAPAHELFDKISRWWKAEDIIDAQPSAAEFIEQQAMAELYG
ncbi:MAG: ABC transporter substrate-binding protein [Candidatus Micrarchaeota archaeon]